MMTGNDRMRMDTGPGPARGDPASAARPRRARGRRGRRPPPPGRGRGRRRRGRSRGCRGCGGRGASGSPSGSPQLTEAVVCGTAAGAVAAVVGEGGPGKSALPKPLMGFDHPAEGGVLIDRVDPRDHGLASPRARVGVDRAPCRPAAGSEIGAGLKGSAPGRLPGGVGRVALRGAGADVGPARGSPRLEIERDRHDDRERSDADGPGPGPGPARGDPASAARPRRARGRRGRHPRPGRGRGRGVGAGPQPGSSRVRRPWRRSGSPSGTPSVSSL